MTVKVTTVGNFSKELRTLDSCRILCSSAVYADVVLLRDTVPCLVQERKIKDYTQGENNYVFDSG